MGKKKEKLRSVIVISDTHFGSQSGLFPLDKIRLDEGGWYMPSPLQKKVGECWEYFWDWVPKVCHNEPYALVINGDVLDGNHHNATDGISVNLSDQARIAYEVMAPITKKLPGRFYVVRGTEAHSGKSAQEEERLAMMLGAVPNEYGQYARNDLWLEIGGKSLVHFLHHIGTASSNSAEVAAVGRELVEEFCEAGRWGLKPPAVCVRSHRHKHVQVEMPTAEGSGISLVTAGWQLKTGFVYKTTGGRMALPQIGGHLIRHDDDGLYTRKCVWNMERSALVRPE